MRRTPAFTATALATLAVCLGANLTIFAVVDAVLLRPLPFPQGDRLVRVFNTYPKAGVPDDGCSLTNYYERRGRIGAFERLAVYRDGHAIVGETGATAREPVARVSPEFFATLGVGPVAGRAFTDQEMAFQSDAVAIVTDAYWRQQLGSDPRVLGRRIRVDGTARTVVGVLPREFAFLSSKARLYFPLASDSEQRGPARRHWGSQADMIARLKPGVALGDAQAQVDAHNAAMEADSPEARRMADAGFRSLVVPLRADHVAGIRPMLLLVQTGALFLLLIGAVNMVNLLLIRASARMKEFAVRQAIGASARHVVREVLVETTVLTLAGGVLGVCVAAAGVRLLGAFGTDRLPLGGQVAFDGRVALTALAAALAIGIAIGLPIALYNLRGQTVAALHAQGRGATAGRAAQRLRHGFIVAQMALAFVLLAGAGLLAVSLDKVLAQPTGFRPENVVSGQISLPWSQYRSALARVDFVERLVAAVGRQPGIRWSGVVTNVPMSGRSGRSAATVVGHALRPGEPPHGIYSYGVGGDYFAAMGFTLRAGRFLTAADSRRPDRVCVVDDDFAQRYWPNGRALGQRLFQGGNPGPNDEAFTVVGVVGAVKQDGLTEQRGQGAVFYPFVHRADGDLFVVARTSGSPESFAGTLQRVVRGVDSELPLTDLRSMEGRIADSLVARRSPALLAMVFSAIAVLLTAIGTYGVLSYAVAQRRREIALRMALGAQPGQVRRQFVGIAVRLIGAGTALGLAGAWLTGQTMQAVLFQVPPVHVQTLTAAAAVVAAVSLAACVLPSRRAARVSPMEALAEE